MSILPRNLTFFGPGTATRRIVDFGTATLSAERIQVNINLKSNSCVLKRNDSWSILISSESARTMILLHNTLSPSQIIEASCSADHSNLSPVTDPVTKLRKIILPSKYMEINISELLESGEKTTDPRCSPPPTLSGRWGQIQLLKSDPTEIAKSCNPVSTPPSPEWHRQPFPTGGRSPHSGPEPGWPWCRC